MNNQTRTPIRPENAHVLVVEDNVSNFMLIARLLAYVGVQHCEWKTATPRWKTFATTRNWPTAALSW